MSQLVQEDSWKTIANSDDMFSEVIGENDYFNGNLNGFGNDISENLSSVGNGEKFIIDFDDMNEDLTEDVDLSKFQSLEIPNRRNSEDNSDHSSGLPDCKLKRRYVCGQCNLKTLNPREHLYHLKNVHNHNIKIHECKLCTYASKHHQKIFRHYSMVHKMPENELEKYKEAFQIANGTSKVKLAINRSPRESKSPRKFEEYETTNDFEADEMLTKAKNTATKTMYKCDQCSFHTTSAKLLTSHANKNHLKTKLFKCSRCSYATEVKARYTKHVKYHDMPIIKCPDCDFRTPYRWNLDRHAKNHTDNIGEFPCKKCNFSTSIRQSLNFHVANHHLSEEQINERESKRTMGLIDYQEDICDEELELLKLERDEDLDALEIPDISQSFTVSNIELDKEDSSNSSNASKESDKKSKIKMTFKKMKLNETKTQEQNERHNFDEDFIHPDDVVQRNGNVYIKTEKCDLCTFKAPFQIEVQRHKKKVHGILSLKNKPVSQSSIEVTSNEDEIENESDKEASLVIEENAESEETIVPEETSSKKKSSFFDKLHENISDVQNLTCNICGYESKCLSESLRHKKQHLSITHSSTRCQFCRQRCKTTDDLVIHLKTCIEAQKIQNLEELEAKDESSNDDADLEKHSMENKVFVWNRSSNSSVDKEDKIVIESVTSVSDIDFMTLESENMDDIPAENEVQGEPDDALYKKKVYKCTHCQFWAHTASKFHGHMIVHLNKKPFRCSECYYRSNWRWDITKHIKMKLTKEPGHDNAVVWVEDDYGETNYQRYAPYLSTITWGEVRAGEKNAKFRKRNRDENNSATSSPTPNPVSGASTTGTSSHNILNSKIPAPPKLTRAPNRQFNSSSDQSSNQPEISSEVLANSTIEDENAKNKLTMKPPPLVAMGTSLQQPNVSLSQIKTNEEKGIDETSSTGSDKQNTTQATTTVQLLANLAKLKKQQKDAGEGVNPQLDAAVSSQMRLLLWLNCLTRGAEKEKEKSENKTASTEEEIKEVEVTNDNNEESEEAKKNQPVMQMGIDHAGNPEWKCLSCDFRDNESEIVRYHVKLAHEKKGTVSLMHAVHKCSVCGFAAGTKRQVQVHIEQSHNNQGAIISKNEGQGMRTENGGAEGDRLFRCRMCPFTCKKRANLKAHLAHHTPRADFVFKCMFCPYYVANKNDLFTHLSVHGMSVPHASKDQNSANGTNQSETASGSEQGNSESGNRLFICDLCPFETRSRAKLMHHKQFHRPRGLPFNCPHCSYNVTRRHLLSQHLRLHGISATDVVDGSDTPKSQGNSSFGNSKSPSPSLSITPVSGLPKTKIALEKCKPQSDIDPSKLPTLSADFTKNLHEIPLVWVSKDRRFYKMFKCRHCPHVNFRKSNIQDHEKMHRTGSDVPLNGHICQYCSYVCVNAGVLSSHLKVHAGSLGIPHAIVDPVLTNEDQLKMLAGKDGKSAQAKKNDEKMLYYCQSCPARFFLAKEVQIHSKFHVQNSAFSHHCQKCTFGSRDESQQLNHAKVHTPEYVERTRTLMSMHPSAPQYPPISGLSVTQDVSIPEASQNSQNFSNVSSLISNGGADSITTMQPPPTSKFKCDQCPSTFRKLLTLQYHQSLHSADNPHKCTRCTYAAKTETGLQQHVALHDKADSEKNSLSSAASSLAPSPLTVNSSIHFLNDSFSAIEDQALKMKISALKDSFNLEEEKRQFKYYLDEQVPLSGVELMKRKTQIEKDMPKELVGEKIDPGANVRDLKTDTSGNPSLHYPLFIDKTTGRTREKRYKCSLCPSAFEKMDQYNVHINLHGSNYKYKCKICNYTVKFYANFMMHVKRHIYHDKMYAQRCGTILPSDVDPKYEPTIGENPVVEQTRAGREFLLVENSKNKENINKNKVSVYDFSAYPDMTMTERQNLLLQEKKADSFKTKNEDFKVFYCQYCPYANLRRDAVDSHSLRHKANMGRGLYQCNFCDYNACQPNFIREHTKVHFRTFKYVQPEGFLRHDKMEILSINNSELVENEDERKIMIFSHDEGVFEPEFKPDGIKFQVDYQIENGIKVDLKGGDIVDAPSSCVIPLNKKCKKAMISNGSIGIISGKKLKYSRKDKKIKDDSSLTVNGEMPFQTQKSPKKSKLQKLFEQVESSLQNQNIEQHPQTETQQEHDLFQQLELNKKRQSSEFMEFEQATLNGDTTNLNSEQDVFEYVSEPMETD